MDGSIENAGDRARVPSIDGAEPAATRPANAGNAASEGKPSTPILQLENVSRSFGPVAAVKDISLCVEKGEIIALVGRSGCGKSSLLRLIAGVDAPQSGHISVAGREVAGADRFVEPEDRNIGFVFQDYALFPHLTARQNIAFGLNGKSRQAIEHRVLDVSKKIGITSLLDRYPYTLSGGEQQRVALARALAPEPELILMDEPFSNLDIEMRDRIREETIATLRAHGKTAIIVTHEPMEALRIGDRIVLMKAGTIEQVGTGREVYCNPVSLYAAEALSSGNPVYGVRRGAKIETALGHFAANEAVAEGEWAVVFIRPQAVSPAPKGNGAISAKLLACTFAGDRDVLQVRVQGLIQPLTIHARAGSGLRSGEEITLDIDPASVFVFPADRNHSNS